jgi:carboxymethylenebutenolidase
MSTIMLTADDGHEFSAYVAGPEDAEMGLVIVQEIFGVNSHMRHASDTFAAAGFRVICPALFDRAERDVELGYTGPDMQKGIELRGKIADDKTMLDIEAAAAELGTEAIGIVGYCWGGTIAWWGATRSETFDVAVGWYGGGIAGTKTETPNCPVQLHFGGQDDHIPQSDIDAISEAQPDVEIFVYDDAGHGFGCEQRPSFEPASYELAQSRTLEFLRENLG